MDHRITDFVDQSAIDRLKELNDEMQKVKSTYVDVAQELLKGLKIKVEVIGDVDKLYDNLAQQQQRAAQATETLSRNLTQQRDLMANTTNTISRQLMEQEKLNEKNRTAYERYTQVHDILGEVVGDYQSHAQRLAQIEMGLSKVNEKKKAEKDAYDKGLISQKQYEAELAKLIEQHRQLSVEKSNLTRQMKMMEKEEQVAFTSYDAMSQQLAQMKRAYRELNEEGRNSEIGQNLLAEIKELGAHLKDLDASMGDFHRNVGDYAIACQNGVTNTEDLNRVLGIEAATIAGCIEQNKALEKAKATLDTRDADYAQTLEKINAKIEENKRRITDVDTILQKQATTVAEAEAQNKQLVEALKLVDLNSAEAETQIQELNAKIEENKRLIEEATPALQDNADAGKEMRKELKEMALEIAYLTMQYRSMSEEEQSSAAGQALAQHIQELTEQAGELKDAISDSNQAISNAASDTRGFDQVSEGLKFLIDGFGLAEGAAQMLGITTEDLAEVQANLQAAIAASNAMQSIQNALQSQSALMQGVNLVQTNLRTAAENLHTAAQGKGVIATTAATAAQWAFNAAASANPIGLLIVGLVAAAAAVWGLVKAFQAFFGPSDEALENYAKQKKALEDMCAEHDKEIDRMKARGATESEMHLASLQFKQEEYEKAQANFELAKELYDKDSDEYKEALEAKKKAEEEFEQQKKDSLNYLEKVIREAQEEEKKQALGTYEYKRQLIQAELEMQKVLAAKLREEGKITEQIYQNLCASLDKAAQMKITKVNEEETKANTPRRTSGGSRSSSSSNSAEDRKRALQAGEDALLKVIVDSLERQRLAEMQGYARKLKELEEHLAKVKATDVKLREAINNEIRGLVAEHNRKMEELEFAHADRYNKAEAGYIASHLAIVEEGSKEELEWKLKALDNQRVAEDNAITKAEKEKTITVEQAEEMRANLVEKYAKLRTEAEESYGAAQVKAIEDRYASAAVVADNACAAEIQALRAKYAEELSLAGNNEEKRAEATRRFESESAAVAEKYAQERAKSSVGMLEEMLKVEDMSAEDRKALEAELTRAKIAYEEAVTEAVIRANEEQVKSDKDATKKRIENAQKWLQVASDSLNAINDLASAIYDAKISKVEEEQDALDEAAAQEEERITQLVEQKVITEEEGEARRRAAEDETARKKEELEKKKQQLQYKQAVWDKANSIAQIGINTATAIMRCWSDAGPFGGPVMAAIVGALGAIQLATVLATPIPKYAKGTSNHPGGPAIVGDGGKPELVTYGSQMFVTPDKPILMDLPKGATVYPDADMILPTLLSEGADRTPDVVVNNDYRRLEDKVETLTSLLRRIDKSRRREVRDADLRNYIQTKGL